MKRPLANRPAPSAAAATPASGPRLQPLLRRVLLASSIVGVLALPAWAIPVAKKHGDGLVVSGAAGLPDLQRGKQAAQDGRVADAERDLVPLARRGYVDAQIALGHMYSVLHTPAADRKAVHWLSAALPEASDPVPALAGLIAVYADSPGLDTQHRLPALAARAESLDLPLTNAALLHWYRRTPQIDHHQQRLLRLCRAGLAQSPECYTDLVKAARQAHDSAALKQLTDSALKGYARASVPAQAVASMATALVEPLTPGQAVPVKSQAKSTPTPTTPTPPIPAGGGSCAERPIGGGTADGDQADNAAPMAADAQPALANLALGKLIAAGTPAQVQAAAVVLRAPYLAPDFDVEAALRRGVADGLPGAALLLGQLYLDGARSTRQPRRAQKYLRMALAQPDTALAAHFYLGRLYQRGYLDQAAPVPAAKNLLFAARHGYGPADSALARLFANGKGVCPNRVYAYVFALLGASEGGGSIETLLDQLKAALTPAQRAGAQQLLRSERQLRQHSTSTQFARDSNGEGNT